MSMRISVDDRAAQDALGRVADVARRPAMRPVAAELEQRVRQTFRDERDPWGAPWPPHSPITLAMRRRRGEASRQRLIDSGRMYASIRSGHDDTTASIEVGQGLPDPRAVVQQFGTPNAGRGRRVRIPARPFFPMRSPNAPALPEPWWASVLAIIEKQVEDAIA